MANDAPAVFRNPRYERRISELESSVSRAFEALDFLYKAMQALGEYMRARDEILPGEMHSPPIEEWTPVH